MRHARPARDWRIAETGGLSAVTAFLAAQGYAAEALKGDFRYRIEAADASVDLLLSCEVFEHIKDQEPASFDDLVNFNFSGARTFMAEMRRVIRPGGLLAMTTPNACSLRNLMQLLDHEPPWLFWPHVKEYAPAQVLELARDAGFAPLFHETFFALFHLDRQREAVLREMFTERGASAEGRGDIAFYLFRRP